MALPSTTTFNTGTAQANDPRMSTPGRTYEGNINIPGSVTSPDAPTIPIGTVNSGVQPLNLPNTPTSTAIPGMNSSAGGVLSTPPQIQQQQQEGTFQPTGDYKKDFMGQLDAISARPGQLAEQYGIAKKLEDYNAAKTKYDLLKESYRVQKEQQLMNGALSADQKQARIGELERKEAFSAGTLAIEYAAKNQDYASAKELMNQQIQMELEPMKMKADFYRDMFMKTEDQRFARAMKAEDRAYDAAKANADLLNDVKMQAYKDGKISAADIGKITSWDDFSSLTGMTEVDAMAEAGARSTIDTIDSALGNKRGLRASAGVGLFSRNKLFRGKVGAKFIGDVEQIAGQLTIDKLIAAKSSGATFGALSDGERQLLAAASTRLGTWAVRNGDGRITGWKVGEGEVKKELEKIKEFAKLDYERRTGRPYTTDSDPAGLGIDASELDPAGIFTP